MLGERLGGKERKNIRGLSLWIVRVLKRREETILKNIRGLSLWIVRVLKRREETILKTNERRRTALTSCLFYRIIQISLILFTRTYCSRKQCLMTWQGWWSSKSHQLYISIYAVRVHKKIGGIPLYLYLENKKEKENGHACTCSNSAYFALALLRCLLSKKVVLPSAR
jgi:hypothetical protein